MNVDVSETVDGLTIVRHFESESEALDWVEQRKPKQVISFPKPGLDLSRPYDVAVRIQNRFYPVEDPIVLAEAVAGSFKKHSLLRLEVGSEFTVELHRGGEAFAARNVRVVEVTSRVSWRAV